MYKGYKFEITTQEFIDGRYVWVFCSRADGTRLMFKDCPAGLVQKSYHGLAFFDSVEEAKYMIDKIERETK